MLTALAAGTVLLLLLAVVVVQLDRTNWPLVVAEVHSSRPAADDGTWVDDDCCTCRVPIKPVDRLLLCNAVEIWELPIC